MGHDFIIHAATRGRSRRGVPDVANTLGVGIIGAGGIANLTHIPGYKGMSDRVRLIAVADVLGDRADEVAAEHEIPMAFDDYNRLLELEEIDVVSVCTPPVAHMAATIAALDAGKHVLCEKPMAMTAAQAQKMIDAAERSGRKLAIGFQSRFSDSAGALKRLIDGGELGDVYYGRAVYNRRRGIPSHGMFHSREQNGGGPLIDVGVHVLDLALWLMGNPKPVSVLGSAYCKFGNRDDVFNGWGPWNHEDFDVEDFATAMIRLDNGATLNLEYSWALNIEEDLRSIVLCGDEGGAQLHPLKVFKDDGKMLIDWDPHGLGDTGFEEMHARSLANFIDAVINDTETLVRPGQGLHVAQIVDAIYRSSETGELATI